jgi:phage terminase small subunit
MPELTEQQSNFVEQLVSTGCTQTEAARRAGYADASQEAWRLMRKPHVLAAVREHRERLISGSLSNIAAETLREVMENKSYPASSRVAAARAVWEAAGHFAVADKGKGQDQPLNEMTEEQLRAFIERCDRIVSGEPLAAIKVVDAITH